MACAAVVVAAVAVIVGSAPEELPGTPVAQASSVADVIPTEGGPPFPEFTLTEADGMSITKASLAGKKALIWFTQSGCPDADGMHHLAEFNDELGAKAVTVVVVLVDLQKPEPWLGEWRDGFGRPDWKIAPAHPGSLPATLTELSLETKILLDEHGTVLDTTTRLVDPDYLDSLREHLAP